MRNLIKLTCLLVVSFSSLCAQDIKDNGKNLASICTSESCNYLSLSSTFYYPNQDNQEWEIRNMELAVNNSGNFITTGDLYVHGVDSAAVVTLALRFYSMDYKLFYTYTIPEFQFYNDKEYAEPFVFTGKMGQDVVDKIFFYEMDVVDSKKIPFTEISSDCSHSCKEIKLMAKRKEFRKLN